MSAKPISIFHRVKSRFRALPPSAISQFATLAEPTEKDRILFFAPHPDDEALAAGGFLHRAVKKSAHCKIILVTDGNRRGLKEIRLREFAEVLNALGLDSTKARQLNYPNGHLQKQDAVALTRKFEEIIEEYKPTYVITPHPADLHGEHVITADLVAAHHANAPHYTLLQYLIHYPPHYPWPRSYSPHLPLLPPTNLTLKDENWQIFPLTPEEVEFKKSVIELYPSQLKTPILRSLMYALIRSNELFLVYSRS